jgi:diadenylate cyclase
MSQESDAIVVVVSEQTGDISMADRGRLARKLTADQLRAALLTMLGREETAAGPPAAAAGLVAEKPAEKSGEKAVA